MYTFGSSLVSWLVAWERKENHANADFGLWLTPPMLADVVLVVVVAVSSRNNKSFWFLHGHVKLQTPRVSKLFNGGLRTI